MEKLTKTCPLCNSYVAKADSNMSDIPDGTLYKNLYCKSNINTNVIILTLNSDGVSVY